MRSSRLLQPQLPRDRPTEQALLGSVEGGLVVGGSTELAYHLALRHSRGSLTFPTLLRCRPTNAWRKERARFKRAGALRVLIVDPREVCTVRKGKGFHSNRSTSLWLDPCTPERHV